MGTADILARPKPESAQWWAEVDASLEKVLESVPEAEEKLLRIIEGCSADNTHFWNIVERLGRRRETRRALIPYVLRRAPSVFTRHILARWWEDLTLWERFEAFTVHGAFPKGSAPAAWLFLYPDTDRLARLGIPEILPHLWGRMSVSQKKRAVKRFPALVYLVYGERPCLRLRMLWYLAKRRTEFLPLAWREIRENPCKEDAEIIRQAALRRFRHLLRSRE